MFSKPLPKLPEPSLPRSSLIVAQRESSAECHAFQKCFSVLADGITDPGWLAIQLYSKELIGSDIRTEAQKQVIEERVKIEKLLSAVEKHILVSPATKFREFLDVLQSEPSLQHLARRLESTYHEFLGQCTHGVPTLTSTPLIPPLSTTCASPLPVLCSDPQYPSPSSCLPIPPTKRPKMDHFLRSQHFMEHTIILPDIQQVLDQATTHIMKPATFCSSEVRHSAVESYSFYLKSVYTREKLPIYDKWPQVKSKKYINLACPH